MKKTLISIAMITLFPLGAAFAGGNDCAASQAQWQSREAAMQVAAQNNWTVREF